MEMIGPDTNVSVRYLVQDDDRQSPIASQIIDALTAEVRSHHRRHGRPSSMRPSSSRRCPSAAAPPREFIRVHPEHDLCIGSHTRPPWIPLARQPDDILRTEANHGRDEAQFPAAACEGLPDFVKGWFEFLGRGDDGDVKITARPILAPRHTSEDPCSKHRRPDRRSG
jgi:hypothetical protein